MTSSASAGPPGCAEKAAARPAGDPAPPSGPLMEGPFIGVPTGTTRVAAVIGDPIAHSLSPTLHNEAFRALNIDWVYVAFRVAPGDGAAAVGAMRSLGLAGLSVTMPHKAAAAGAVDRLGPVAARLGVVNTVSRVVDGGAEELLGESTDGAGYLDSLAEDGFDPAGRRCLVLGTGGAARAVTLALAGAGAAEVAVAGRSAAAAGACAALAGPAGSAVDASAPGTLMERVEAADLVVNATPVGMGAGDGTPFGIDRSWLTSAHFVSDLIYAPAVTPLLEVARAAGAARANGLGMLIHQAGHQIRMWTGQRPPLEAMSAAAVRALAVRQR